MSSFSIWNIDRTQWYATTPCQSGPEYDGNEGILPILQCSRITGVSLSDRLVSYTELSLGESYPSAEMQWVYSSSPADWADVSIFFFWFDMVCTFQLPKIWRKTSVKPWASCFIPKHFE